MKKWLIVLFLLFTTTSLTFAKIYQIPEELKQDVRNDYKEFKAEASTNESKFNLAMSYAYTGQIKKGWDLLKTIDRSYSKVVIDTYSKKIEEDPNEWRNYFKIAFGYFFAKERETAIDYFYKVLDHKPDMVWAYGFIALIHGEMGEVDTAIKICKKALKMEPQATAIHFLLAEGYRKKGKYFRFVKEMLVVGRLQTEESIRRRGEP
jgi:tetratricopeptide (TPR) repeat protein